MRDTDTNKFLAALAIIATPFALGAFMLAWSPAVQYGLEDPKRDGYVQPRSVTDLVEMASESTVTVWCDPKNADGAQGTAWIGGLASSELAESKRVERGETVHGAQVSSC